jgi:hypothetical protein
MTYTIIIDSIIARNNINRYYETGKIDIDFLTKLSNDAVPQLIRLSSSCKDRSNRKLLEKNLKHRKFKLRNEGS